MQQHPTTPQSTTLHLPRLKGTAELVLTFEPSTGKGGIPASVAAALRPLPPAGSLVISAWWGVLVTLYTAGSGMRGRYLMKVGDTVTGISRAELTQIRDALIASGVEHEERLGEEWP